MMDWWASLLWAPSASSGTSTTDGCRSLLAGGGIDVSLDGCSDSSRAEFCARLFCILSASSGISTTDGCLGFLGPPSNACTSASFGSKGGSASSAGVSGFGLDRLGSSPAFSALAILRAWYLANLILALISGSIGPHIWRRSRNVAEA